MKFIPKVGEEFEYLQAYTVKFVCMDGDLAVVKFIGINCNGKYEGVELKLLKPTKSPAEIEREEAVNEACKLVDTDNGYGFFRNYDNEKVMRLTIEALIRLGYSNKQQVKPLSYQTLKDMCSDHAPLTMVYNLLKPYTIQGGDK